jgi:hypothetical protein
LFPCDPSKITHVRNSSNAK